MTHDELQLLGLTHKEAHLYLACVEHGPSRAKDIAKHSPLNRGTTYDIARSLIKKGLLSTTQKKNITHFVAIPPRKYLRQLEEQAKMAEALLPGIEQLLQSSSYRPQLKFFEGTEGIKQVYEETLTCKSKQIHCFVSIKEIIDEVGAPFLHYYTEKRVRRHIAIKVLKDPRGEEPEDKTGYASGTSKELRRESRLGPLGIDVAGNCMIYDDTVALMSTKRENFGILLHSHEFAVMFRNLFDTIWELSQEA